MTATPAPDGAPDAAVVAAAPVDAGGPVVTDAVRAAFDACLADADEDGARALALELLDRGSGAERVLLELVAPAQFSVGERWAANEWSVAQEHAATYVSEQVVAALAARTRARPATGAVGSVVVTCADGEWHALPARILAEVLRLRGFAVRFLGAHVPAAHLVSYLHQHGPDLVALSCMLPVRLPAAHRTVQAARLTGVPVLAGGAGFGPSGVWARTVGADLYATGAAEAADLLSARWPPPLSGHPALAHLADDEYTRLARSRGDLLRQLTEGLEARLPAMRHYDERQREATVEDLGHLLDFLTAAVFVDDARVLTAFLTASAGILAARGVPPAGLDFAVAGLREPLRAFPRCLGILDAAHRHLADAGHTHPAP
ncbi:MULTISPECIES: cobalamin B12-binding domain-containing protein [Streptomyces]|uniref:cobalamin B12-binding domain-containing protein n=1 Tax=Streptomyces TaxID=1883 RepID=UPI0022494FB6|nr:cobalamin-dependent protein [Streptomyces sp. JHD 1]MCX2967783.1 cobalamin-dependent protein [Streptomyces sp. JHD 1]